MITYVSNHKNSFIMSRSNKKKTTEEILAKASLVEIVDAVLKEQDQEDRRKIKIMMEMLCKKPTQDILNLEKEINKKKANGINLNYSERIVERAVQKILNCL